MSEREAHALEMLAAPAVGVERAIALRDVWGAFWTSRVVVWFVGIAAVFAFGWGRGDARRLDPLFLTAPGRGLGEGLRPHHRVRRDLLWLGLVPLGLFAYLGFLQLSTGDAMAAFTAQSDWHRVFIPLGGIALGAWSALDGLLELMPGGMTLGVHGAGGQYASLTAARDVILFAFLALAAWLSIEAWRRLPVAYSLYSLSALMLPLSFPDIDQPLESLPRFMLVLFPLWIALALWARERRRMRMVLVTMAPLLILSTVLFATWAMAP